MLYREIESMKRAARAQETIHVETERKLLRALQDLDQANSAHLEEEYLLKASRCTHSLLDRFLYFNTPDICVPACETNSGSPFWTQS